MSDSKVRETRVDGCVNARFDIKVLDVRGFLNKEVLIAFPGGERRWIEVGQRTTIVQDIMVRPCD